MKHRFKLLEDRRVLKERLAKYRVCECDKPCLCNEIYYFTKHRLEMLDVQLEDSKDIIKDEVSKKRNFKTTIKHDFSLIQKAYLYGNPQQISIHQISENINCQPETGYGRMSRTIKCKKCHLDWENDIANPILDNAGYQRLWAWVGGDATGLKNRHVLTLKDEKFFEITW